MKKAGSFSLAVLTLVSMSRAFVPPGIEHPDMGDPDHNGIENSIEARIAGASCPELASPIDVIVTLTCPPGDTHLAEFMDLDGVVYDRWEHATYGWHGSVPLANIHLLADRLHEDLNCIELNKPGKAHLDLARANTRVDPIVWNCGWNGDPGMAIATIDSGIDLTHNDLGDFPDDDMVADADDWQNVSTLPGGWAALDSNTVVIGWQDYTSSPSAHPVGAWHGTLIAGILAGRGLVNSAYSGMAPEVRLAGVRISYTTAEAISGFNWIVADTGHNYRIMVANLSSGYWGGDLTTLRNAARSVVANGTVLTISAGNDFPSYMYAPQDIAEAITVGAVNDTDQMTDYSSNGDPAKYPKPDIVAPGGSSTVNDWITGPDNTPCDGYDGGEGTSFAAPAVAGIASLVIDAMGVENWNYTEADVMKIKQVLLMTAWETNQPGEAGSGNDPPLNRGTKDRVEGYGRVCADAAVDAVTTQYMFNVGYLLDFGPDPPDQKVKAFNMYLDAAMAYDFSVYVPAGADFDFYIFEYEPDSYGEPVITLSLTTAGSVSESIGNWQPPYTGWYYGAVKAVTATTMGGFEGMEHTPWTPTPEPTPTVTSPTPTPQAIPALSGTGGFVLLTCLGLFLVLINYRRPA